MEPGVFTPYGPSHWGVLAVFAAGTAVVVVLGRRQRHRDAETVFSRAYAATLVVLLVAAQVYSWVDSGWAVDRSVPLHLSDLAGPVAAYALWTQRHWAFSLTYYWCLTLSTQALFSPVLGGGPDFPHQDFLAFWLLHLLVVWAAIYLTWGVGLRPDWRGYRAAVVITLSWVAVAMAFNAATGTNYGYLNRKPETASLLDLFGPWPWYLLPEITLALAVWALMTWPWTRRRSTSNSATALG